MDGNPCNYTEICHMDSSACSIAIMYYYCTEVDEDTVVSGYRKAP